MVIEFKSTDYFRYRMSLPDRRHIREQWVMKAIREPLREAIQSDGRVHGGLASIPLADVI